MSALRARPQHLHCTGCACLSLRGIQLISFQRTFGRNILHQTDCGVLNMWHLLYPHAATSNSTHCSLPNCQSERVPASATPNLHCFLDGSDWDLWGSRQQFGTVSHLWATYELLWSSTNVENKKQQIHVQVFEEDLETFRRQMLAFWSWILYSSHYVLLNEIKVNILRFNIASIILFQIESAEA